MYNQVNLAWFKASLGDKGSNEGSLRFQIGGGGGIMIKILKIH